MAYKDKDKEKQAAYAAKYYAEHKREIATYNAKYRAEHKDKATAYNAEYRATHKNEIATRQAKWEVEHKDERATSNAKYRAEHKNRIAKQRANYYIEHKEEIIARRLTKSYGLPTEGYSKIFLSQNGVCAICGDLPNNTRFTVDHSHFTGKVRGLLCSNCNAILGFAHDSIEILAKTIEYLKKDKMLLAISALFAFSR